MKILGRLVLLKVFYPDFILWRQQLLTRQSFVMRHPCLLLLKLERINDTGYEVYLIFHIQLLKVIFGALPTEEGSDPLFRPHISQYQL